MAGDRRLLYHTGGRLLLMVLLGARAREPKCLCFWGSLCLSLSRALALSVFVMWSDAGRLCV